MRKAGKDLLEAEKLKHPEVKGKEGLKGKSATNLHASSVNVKGPSIRGFQNSNLALPRKTEVKGSRLDPLENGGP